MNVLRAAVMTGILVVLVGGCASLREVGVGSRREVVLEKFGAPTQRLALASGERFIYSGGVEDRETWIFEFDTSGQLVSRIQARTMERIAQVAAGQKRTDVEALIGSSMWTKRSVLIPDELMYIYRLSDFGVPMCFYVYYGTADTVVRTGMQQEITGSNRWGPPC